MSASPADPLDQPAIATRELCKRFRRRLAVDRVSLRVRSGSIFGVLGQEGAGKTTLLGLLCGLVQPTFGQVRILGIDAMAHRFRLRRMIGYMGQRVILYPALTLMQNLQILGDLRGLSGSGVRARFTELCDQLGILAAAAQPAATLPVSVQKLAGLCFALVGQPRVLLIDEPGAGLDEGASATLWSMLEGTAAAGTTILFTSHAPAEMERCQTMTLLDEGRVLCEGPPGELRARHIGGWQFCVEPASESVKIASLAEALTRRGYLVDVHEAPRARPSLTVFSQDASAASRMRLEHDLRGIGATLPHSARLDLPSMEQVFNEVVAAQRREAP